MLTAMQGNEPVADPPFTQAPHALRKSGDSVGEKGSEVVARIKSAVAVVAFKVKAVLRQQAAGLRHLVEGMAPDVAGLRGEPMIVCELQNGLEGVEVAVCDGAQLIDVSVRGKLREIRPASLLYVRLC